MAERVTSRLPASGFKKRLTATVILLNLFVYCYIAATAYQSKLKYEKQTAISTQNLAILLDQQIKDEIISIDLVLLAVKHEAETQIETKKIDKEALKEYIVLQHSHLPFLQGIRLLNSKGDVEYGTGGIIPGLTVNLAFRDYFIAQRDNPKGDLFVSKPVMGLVAKTWVINFSRRLNNPDGSFAGIVYAALALDHYVDLFSRLKISANSSISLRDGELALIARFPQLENTIGSRKVSEDLATLVKTGNRYATYKARAGVDDAARTITYRKISNYPLHIIVALAEDEYLAAWRKEILTLLGMVVIFTIVTFVSRRMLLRKWSREQEILSDLNNARLALELRSERDRAQAYLDTVETIIVALDAEGRITTINRKGCQVLGCQEDELKGKNWFSCCLPQPEGIETLYQLFSRFMSGKAGPAPEYQEYPITMESGELRQIAWHNAVLYDEQGLIIGLLCAGEDITERKLASETLATSERFLKTIFDSEPECIKLLDSDCNLLLMNPAGLEMIQADFLEQVKGQCLSPLITEPFRHDFIALTKQVFRGIPGTLTFETVGLKGRHLWLETHAVPFRNERGEIVSLLGITRDVTERKKAEEERLIFEQQLIQAQKLESLGVLAGGIAHDFNNILTAIMGNISFARMDLDASQRAHEPLERAEKAAKRAAALAKQLLVFSTGGEPVKKLISVRQSVNEAVALVLSGSSVEASIDLPADLHAVNADEGQLSQAFNNIIINAVQSMPDGGKLTVSAQNLTIAEENSLGLSGGDYVEISFSDEGCGIAAEDLERIFDPYFTNKISGSGLGLASTYAIIKKHGGHISVSSTLDMGSTFTILIPGCGEPVNEELEEEHAPVPALGGYSILVMDDDEMVRELAAITLKRMDYEVVCCDNGATAVALYRTTREAGIPFSLVIMDLTIPGGMGGIEAARQILAFDPEAQLIVSSGYSDDPVMANFSDYGFCAALEKPYNVEDINRILQVAKQI